MIENPYLLTSAPLTFQTTGISLPAFPGVNLTNDNMDLEWRSSGLQQPYFVLGCAAPVDTIAVLYTNLRHTDKVRIRAGATWDGTVSNPVYDSGEVEAYQGTKADPFTTKTIIDLALSVTAPFWRFDFVAPDHPDGQIKVARVVMGERFEIKNDSDNLAGIRYGWEPTMYDDSTITTGPNYEDVQEYPSRPGVKATLGSLDEDTANRLYPFMMRVGFKKPVLFAPEPSNLDTAQHWTVYGRLKATKFQNPYYKWWDIDVEVSGLKS